MKKKVLVTGGAGFIGSNFCNINKEKYDIVVLDNLFLGTPSNLHPDIKFIKGDACKNEDLAKCGDDFDIVLHFAGTSSAPMFMGDGFADGYVNSIESFVRTLEFARKTGAKKFLYASTSSIYGNNPLPLVEDQQVVPPNHYAVTKFTYEHCTRMYNHVYPEMDTIGFRFMSVYGPNEEAKGRYANMITQFLWDLARDLPPVIYGTGEQFRDFTNVKDIVAGITLALEKENLGNKVYNIGRGESTSFNDIFKAINQVLGKNIQPIYIENPVKEGYVKGQHADIHKIQSELGFKPTVELLDGIRDLADNLDRSRIKETSSDSLR
ncbi:nucleoside-diphosphate sugar epimerase [Candidatus Uhrbacteria bacterium CG_4_9_14_3_um_filter_41_35]|uniref:Nucleoside-diphosphate sugar epimerase n=1 Tax=Candidatus Uhrbacteria bacterium CG_4_9_14_3_um_filter_41_35 TaxID=1975034 RepID=A0A2M7XFM4_9BACT|nr:MAG: nucleoside-diphosphate sugar epimerase [Candidatus Uhrbacteria bacterium CG11_big_fil_rev_8_21_14_0_20_41_9]PJA46659.1 MAG: nucleoside-diphosphate sugar epimerase [Candidatus Uhrbacteria bacterium CG_4_9_14_3_um_filter_41_35]